MPKPYTFPADNVWFTSDTHFGHTNILRFCKRPFGSIEEMDKALIRNWNETVPPDGIVFHLGDFAFAKPEDWERYANALNGRKYLILGNHDFRRIMDPCMKCFEEVAHQMTIRVDGQAIILNHNPFLCYGGAYADTWQLFGHVHSGPLSTVGKDLPRLEMLFPTQYDVGVDNNDFRPVSFEEVKQKIARNTFSVEEILQEHLRTPYKHKITPFEGVPVLEGEVAKKFVDICDNNSKLASSEYDKSRNDWVNNILSKKHL